MLLLMLLLLLGAHAAAHERGAVSRRAAKHGSAIRHHHVPRPAPVPHHHRLANHLVRATTLLLDLLHAGLHTCPGPPRCAEHLLHLSLLRRVHLTAAALAWRAGRALFGPRDHDARHRLQPRLQRLLVAVLLLCPRSAIHSLLQAQHKVWELLRPLLRLGRLALLEQTQDVLNENLALRYVVVGLPRFPRVVPALHVAHGLRTIRAVAPHRGPPRVPRANFENSLSRGFRPRVRFFPLAIRSPARRSRPTRFSLSSPDCRG
mmetsp:Transcript_9470/g.26398  ORF Transcript_9470/g.26398 Transcript_9470/m.26398 type:complete len:261 (+) Transcript_9470:2066-2848(+)